MPECGSQILICNLPVRFDTYIGCAHACSYCFVKKKKDITEIKLGETKLALRSFIDGKRKRELSWCDWDIPLHWGGMSDPFQPAEAKYRNSFECLKVFAETNYPYVFSTKGRLVVDSEYLNLISQSNAVSQVSMVSPKYDKLEPGAPPYQERLSMLEKLAKASKRLIVRISPYSAGLADDVCSHLQQYKDSGVFGVEIEGMKRQIKLPGMVKVGGDFCYPVEALRRDYEQIKTETKRLGMAFFCGENRLRAMSDSSTCCGCEGVDGFKPNKANLNALVFGKDIEYTEAMKEPGSGSVFIKASQSTRFWMVVSKESYKNLMEIAAQTKTYLKAMGLHHTDNS